MPYADVEGARIRYERSGRGQPLVLISGLAGTAESWARAVPMLSDRFDVLTLDNRGSGGTTGTGEFTVPVMADDVAALLDDLGIGSAHVLGWSMGSHIAISLAARHPHRVRSLVVVSSYLFRPARSAYILNAMAEGYRKGELGAETVGQMLNVMLHTEGFFRYAEASGRVPRTAAIPPADGFYRQVHEGAAHDAGPEARALDLPVLCINGLEDIMTPPSVCRALADAIPGCSRLEVPGEGHSMRPESYIPAAKRFMLSHRSELKVVDVDVMVGRAVRAEPAGDAPRLLEPELLVERPRAEVLPHHGVEYQQPVAARPRLLDAVPDEELADPLPARGGVDGVARVRHVPAPTYAVRVEDVEADGLAVDFGDADVVLPGEEPLRPFGREALLLGEGVPLPHDLVPDLPHAGNVLRGVPRNGNFAHASPPVRAALAALPSATLDSIEDLISRVHGQVSSM